MDYLLEIDDYNYKYGCKKGHDYGYKIGKISKYCSKFILDVLDDNFWYDIWIDIGINEYNEYNEYNYNTQENGFFDGFILGYNESFQNYQPYKNDQYNLSFMEGWKDGWDHFYSTAKSDEGYEDGHQFGTKLGKMAKRF